MRYPTRDLRPALTLRDVFGAEPVFNPRASFSDYGWLPRDQSRLDSLTGGILPAAGGVPTICSTGVATAAGLELLAAAGVPKVETLLTYADEAGYHERIAAAVSGGRPIMVQHVHRAAEIPASSYAIPRRVLAFLNNKGNLGELVPAEAVPSRRLMASASILQLAARPRWKPLAVKAVSDRSSGGGDAVVLARSPADLVLAARKFAGCRQVVVEEFLPFDRTFCLNFALTWDGRIQYLGAGEQVVTGSGEYRGNWFALDRQPPVEAVEHGREIMRRAAERGYFGFAGFDVGVLPDGRVKVFDLNFRTNGSTKALLFMQGVQEAFAAPPLSLLTGLQAGIPFSRACGVAREALRRGIFVPLSTFDPAAVPGSAAAPSLSGLVLGESRRDVIENLKYLASHGLTSRILEDAEASASSTREVARGRRAA